MQPDDFLPLTCACKKPHTLGLHDSRHCTLPHVGAQECSCKFVIKMRHAMVFPDDMSEQEMRNYELEEKCAAKKILCIDLPRGTDKSIARAQCKKTRLIKSLLRGTIPIDVAEWWRKKRGDDYLQYLGTNCSCGTSASLYKHANDVCCLRNLGIRSFFDVAQVVLVTDQEYMDDDRPRIARKEIVFVVVPHVQGEQLRNTFKSRNKYMTALPKYAKRFWRNTSRKKYRVLLRNIVEQSAIAPLSSYIEQNY
jgi:hypothetical protein